jgi:hypothetical protein
MRKTHVFLSAGLTLLALAGTAARADDTAKTDDFARRMFATTSIDHKTYACFVRTYDAQHLARHRKQTVSAMKMLISSETLAEDSGLTYGFRMGVKFRNRKGEFAGNYQCGHARASDQKGSGVEVSCGGDCGGGGIEIALGPTDKSIIVRVEEIGLTAADNAGFEFSGGADDKVFRLDRTGLENCASVAGDELADLQRK